MNIQENPEHLFCPTCGKRVTKKKQQAAVKETRGRPISKTNVYEVRVTQDDKEIKGSYPSILQAKKDLNEKGFNISINQLFCCLKGKHKYENLK